MGVLAPHSPVQAGKYLKERDVIIEFFENEADFKPLTLTGNSPATKLFLKDLKARTPRRSTPLMQCRSRSRRRRRRAR